MPPPALVGKARTAYGLAAAIAYRRGSALILIRLRLEQPHAAV